MFIEILKIELNKRNITFNKMCKDLKFTSSIKNKWEEGQQPRIDKLKAICEYLNISSDYLLELDNKEPNINISGEEYIKIKCYRKASKQDKEIVDNILDRYKEKEGKSSISNAG